MTSLKINFRGGYLIAVSCCLLALSIAIPSRSSAQATDTMRLTVQQAGKLFLENNLELLAQHYNVEANRALIQQTRLWDNPELTTDQVINADGKWLQHGSYNDGTPKGQYFIQLQQLIKTAGKRGKLVDMATTNADMAYWQFNQVMQQLKFELYSAFYIMIQKGNTQTILSTQHIQLEKLLAGMKGQLQTGNIARKDWLRIQALELKLRQDIAENLKDIEDNQATLKSLLGITENVFLEPIEEIKTTTLSVPLPVIIDSAKQNNASFRLEQYQLRYEQQNLRYQKALAVPDIEIAASYDHNSNYAPRYFGMGVSLPIPLLNRNKGNITSAQWQVKQQETHLSQQDITLTNDVTAAYNNYQHLAALSDEDSKQFLEDYSLLQSSISDRFNLRQIGLLEFIDYFNDYKDIMLQRQEQQLKLRMAREELNLQAGTELFH